MASITGVFVRDIRFPTSQSLDGSDAMNKDPDYSAAYVVISTTTEGLEGHGLTFTIGRGQEVVVAAVNALKHLLIGRKVDDCIGRNMGKFFKHLTGDSQIRWIGPDKGAIGLAQGAVLNAIWDLWGRITQKPLWALVCDLTPEEFVDCLDFSYVTDALTKEEALDILRKAQGGKEKRRDELLERGYPAYTTSAGWLGYSDDKLRRLCQESVDAGFSHVKLKVGADLEDDKRRLKIAREVIGPDRKLMIDANQRWEVSEAIAWVKALQKYNPWFIEEPTNPDDVLGHLKIKQGITPTRVASGEMCQNRIMFKQFIQSGALDVVQVDSCRMGGVNEVLLVHLMAHKFGVPVCPHAGGVGLCEYVQHLAMIDYVCVSGSLEDRVLEFVDHLHEHFLEPVVMKNGHYMPPKLPGYSIEMKKQSLDDYEFPRGPVWRNADVAAGGPAP